MKVESDCKKIAKKLKSKLTDRCSRLPDGGFLVALSGGADSVTLLNLLSRQNRRIVAVHCNFHLRGQESMRDECFCRALCDKSGIDLIVKNFDTMTLLEKGESVEMACRRIRYEYFRMLMSQLNLIRIVTGHNADDNLETLLLNLTRGAGIHGLSGMDIDNGEIFRPLLDITRCEIESYLHEIGESWITDSTNLENDYNRNFIRNEIVSRLKERFPTVIESVARSQSILKGECKIIDDAIDSAISQSESSESLSWDILEKFPDRISVIREFLKGRGVSHATLRQISDATLREQKIGKHWRLKDTTLYFERDGMYLYPDDKFKDEQIHSLKCRRVKITPDALKEMKMPGRNDLLWLPRSLEHYNVRHPKKGDRIKPLGMKGSSLLSDIMTDNNLSALQRGHLWVVEDCEDGEIVWVEGLKRSRCHLVNPDADQMYCVWNEKKTEK